MKCSICEVRKSRRYCLGLRTEICSVCCGNEREQTVDCPLECEYLREAHLHEKLPELDPKTLPNADVPVTHEFIESRADLVVAAGAAVLQAALATPGAVDADAREAIGSLVRTYRTLQSGLYYETRPDNPLARAIHDGVREAMDALRGEMDKAGGTRLRDADILGVLAFLERIALSRENGRKKSKAFLDFLRSRLPVRPRPEPTASVSLIETP